MSGFEEILAGWTIDQRRRGLERQTIAVKVRQIRLADGAFDVLGADEESVAAFLDRRDLCDNSRNNWIATFLDFYRWATRKGFVATNPIEEMGRPKNRVYLPRPVTDSVVTMVLGDAPPKIGAWVTLMAYGGLRCCEVARMQRMDLFEVDLTPMLRVMGKGGRGRIIPAHELVVAVMTDTRWEVVGPMFRGRSGRLVTPARVSGATSRWMHDLGLECTAHQFRHWFATRTYAACHDIRVVQELLGHASPATTAIYTRFSPRAATAAVNALPVAWRPPEDLAA